MSHSTIVTMVLAIVGGSLALAGTIVWLALRAMTAAMVRARAALEREGIVLDSGRRWVTTRYRNYRAAGIYRGAGVAKGRQQLVLTRERLVWLPLSRRGHGVVALAELPKFAVSVAADGALHLDSDEPPRATGSIDYRIVVDDAAAWVKALTDAGARSG